MLGQLNINFTPRRWPSLCLALIAWISLGACVHTRAAAVTATVDRPVITLGETVTLSITLNTRVGQAPNLPPLPNFSVVGRGSSIQIINSQVQQTFTYELSPSQAGDFVIPSFQFNLGGQVASTQPIAVKVLNPGAPPPGGGPPPHFAKIVVPKTQLYVGEVLDIEVQVYFQEGRLRQYPQLPADSGFTIGKWLQPTETRVALSNQAFALVSFKVPITPVKAGQLSLGPATLPLFVPDRSRRADFFFGQPEREIRLTADRLLISVLPLPTNNVPATFAGAVGQYSVNVSAAPTTVAVGDPITARIQVSGRGWLDALTLPPQPDWSEFKLYPPNAKIETRDPNNTTGSKIFEVAVVPQHPGLKALPAFAFSFFDPDQRAYRTVRSPAIPLTVTAAATSTTPLPQLAGATNGAPPATDLAQIKVRLGTIAPTPLLIAQPWFIGLQLVPPALWVTLLLHRKRAESLAHNPRLRRKREVARFVSDGLAELRAHAAANRSDEFFATVFRLLQEQLGERFDVPASSITESVVDERVHGRALPDSTRASLHELFQACNLARYAPVKSSHELSALVTRVEATLRELQQWEPRP